MSLRAGLIGCGRIGSEFDDDPNKATVSTHAGAYKACSEVELVAACDLDREKLKKCGLRWQIPALYQDHGEMLKRESLDIVSICTPTPSHYPIVRDAVKAGAKAIFCEKPIADTLYSADEVVRLCRERGVLLQINHTRRFERLHNEIRTFINQGCLGGIQQVTFYYTAGIMNTGTHLFDLLRFFFGDAEWVQALFSERDSHRPEDPNFDGLIKLKKGALCAIQACDEKYFRIFEMDCLGERGRLMLTRFGFDVEYYEVKESDLFPGLKEALRSQPPFHREWSAAPMIAAVQQLAECLREHKEPLCSGEDGRAALELVFACHESAQKSGSRVLLPLKATQAERSPSN